MNIRSCILFFLLSFPLFAWQLKPASSDVMTKRFAARLSDREIHEDGSLSATITGKDPFFDNFDVGLEAKNARYVVIDMAYTGDGGDVQVFINLKSASGERETDFIDIVVWRQQGENCANYLSKGKLAAVDGQLRVRSYETQDGQKRRAYEVVADNVRFLSPKEGGSAPSGTAYGASAASEPSPFGAGDMVGDDDLPF